MWLRHHPSKRIIFCENSGHDLRELRDTYAQQTHSTVEVEFLSFDGQNFPPSKGKGYGEMRIIAHALEHSTLLRRAERFMKVTGRLYVANAAQILAGVARSRADVQCDLRQNLLVADSRAFCATKAFFSQYLLTRAEQVDDSNNLVFESVLAQAVHACLADGGQWAPLPRVADLRGIAGTANVPIPNSYPHRMMRELFRAVKSMVLNR